MTRKNVWASRGGKLWESKYVRANKCKTRVISVRFAQIQFGTVSSDKSCLLFLVLDWREGTL